MSSSTESPLEVQFHQALLALQAGQSGQAQALFGALVAQYPECKEAWYQLGELAQQSGELTQAIEYYSKVLERDPSIQEVYNNLGVIATRQSQGELASGYFFKALEINPQFAPAHINLGHLFASLNQAELASHHFAQALQSEPGLAKPLFQQAVMLITQGALTAAGVLLQGIVKQGGELTVSALLKWAFCLQRQGLDTQALDCLSQARRLDSDGAVALMDALYLPVVYTSEADLNQWRSRVEAQLAELEGQTELRFERLHEIDWYPFYLAYQGQNDKALLSRLAALITSAVKGSELPAAAEANASGPDTPLRIGWVSRFFHPHSVSRCFLPLLQSFSSKTTHILFRAPGSRPDLLEGPFSQRVAGVVALQPQLEQASQQIAQQNLDILLYTDLGLDPFTWLLASRRLAQLQYVLPGHPVTSGLNSLDGYISSGQLEIPEAQNHYSEPLVLLDHPLVNFPLLPQSQAFNRVDAGLPEGHLYFCPVTLFKLHPAFDAALALILARDPQAQLILFQDQSEGVAAVLKARWQAALGENFARLHLLPWVSESRFQDMLTLADVVLDPFPFGLGTTAYLALAAEVPIVSWPPAFLRGRSVQALYGQLGIQTGLADSLESYAEQAVAFASDPKLRTAWRAQLQLGKDLLFGNALGGQELVVFLRDALTHKRAGKTL
ncbi:MAG: tetratricopeptide repeat protein [Candidatus Sericytochromatia bacterium]